MELDQNPIVQGGSDDSLESPGTIVTGSPEPIVSAPPPEKKSPLKKLSGLLHRVNIYLLLFVLIIIIAGLITFAAIQTSRRSAEDDVISQDLSPEALQELAESGVQVGDPKQTLTIASNSIFNGQVLIRDSLDVAGSLRLGGPLNLTGVTVSGTSTFDDVQIASNLAVSGDFSAQGGLNVAGSGSFGGPVSTPALTTSSLSLNGNLTLTRHIVTSGGIPRVNSGTAVGSGGTVSLSGSDIAGTITINTGSNPPAGVLANISFVRPYSRPPHVVITPVGSAGAGLNFYVTRSANGFSVATTNSPPGSASFSFDYIVIN